MTYNEELLPFCECGECGLRVTKPGNRFIHNHHRRGVSNSPAHNAAISKGKKGIPRKPLLPKHSAAIKKANEESDAVKANIDSMRGGNDIVTHHYIYDHNDLSLNTVKMTRSDHQKLHMLLRKLGYKVPHINVKEE